MPGQIGARWGLQSVDNRLAHSRFCAGGSRPLFQRSEYAVIFAALIGGLFSRFIAWLRTERVINLVGQLLEEWEASVERDPRPAQKNDVTVARVADQFVWHVSAGRKPLHSIGIAD